MYINIYEIIGLWLTLKLMEGAVIDDRVINEFIETILLAYFYKERVTGKASLPAGP